MFKDLMQQKNESMIQAALLHFYDKLGITDEEKKLISIKEVKRIAPGTHGTCAGIYDKTGKLLGINIEIVSYASVIGMIDVLAHELVHARQNIRGEFHFKEVETPVFFGLLTLKLRRKYHKSQDLITTPYYDRVCEQEAHALSHEMVASFFELLKVATDANKKEELVFCHV